MKNNPREQDNGFVVVTVVLSIFFLMGFAALAVDMGFLRFMKRNMQNAADAGAVGAAMAMAHGESGAAPGRFDAAKNGFTHGTDSTNVAVNSPPSKGAFSGNNGFVEVIVTQPQPTFFMNAFSMASVDISARAVAYVEDSGGGCVYVMDPTGDRALEISGSGSLISDCGVFVNSDSEKAMRMSGGACAQASEFNIVGDGAGGGFSDGSSCGATPAPTVGVAPQPDPLIDVPEPEGPFDCTAHPGVVSVGSTGPDLLPGTYCGGIKVSGSATIQNFAAGEYILVGGGLTVSGGASITGDGITFYNTNGQGFGDYKPFVISGGSATSISAPTDGPRVGMVFMADRSIINNKQNTFSGGSAGGIEGIIYLPNLPLVYSGGSAGTDYTIIVAYRLTISGPSYLNSGYGSLPGGESVIRVGTLVE